jgi:hypothetical protein
VSACAVHRDAASLEAVTSVTGAATEGEEDNEDVVLACVPRCLVHVLPLFAAHRAKLPHDPAQARHANHCYDWLLERFSQEVMYKHTTSLVLFLLPSFSLSLCIS